MVVKSHISKPRDQRIYRPYSTRNQDFSLNPALIMFGNPGVYGSIISPPLIKISALIGDVLSRAPLCWTSLLLSAHPPVNTDLT